MSKARRVVHYTDHPCVHHGTQQPFSNERHTEQTDRYHRLYPGRLSSPRLFGCHNWKRTREPLASMFSEDVTCTHCILTIEAVGEGYGNEMIARAWVVCCRHTGAPSPFGDEDTAQLLRREAHHERIEQLADLERHFLLLMKMSKAVDGELAMGAAIRTYTEGVGAALDPALLAEVRPALEDLLLAGDLGDEMSRLLNRVTARARSIRERILRGELEQLRDAVAALEAA